MRSDKGRKRVTGTRRTPVRMGATCVFCERLRAGQFIVQNRLAAAILDAFPLSPGHILVVPRRHQADFLSLSRAEKSAIFGLVDKAVEWIAGTYQPAGYNLGVNVGEAAGQTVPHAHLHLIPRYEGDLPDPRGGVRWILPERAAYWPR